MQQNLLVYNGNKKCLHYCDKITTNSDYHSFRNKFKSKSNSDKQQKNQVGDESVGAGTKRKRTPRTPGGSTARSSEGKSRKKQKKEATKDEEGGKELLSENPQPPNLEWEAEDDEDEDEEEEDEEEEEEDEDEEEAKENSLYMSTLPTLLLAVIEGNYEVSRLLLRCKADIFCQSSRGENLFHLHALYGDENLPWDMEVLLPGNAQQLFGTFMPDGLKRKYPELSTCSSGVENSGSIADFNSSADLILTPNNSAEKQQQGNNSGNNKTQNNKATNLTPSLPIGANEISITSGFPGITVNSSRAASNSVRAATWSCAAEGNVDGAEHGSPEQQQQVSNPIVEWLSEQVNKENETPLVCAIRHSYSLHHEAPVSSKFLFFFHFVKADPNFFFFFIAIRIKQELLFSVSDVVLLFPIDWAAATFITK